MDAGATQKRDLRTGRSLWADGPGLGVPVTPLKASVSADVAVIGSGISGAFVARDLSRDHSVVVLDRRPPLMGSTIASTALLEWELDLPLIALAERVGLEKAQRAYLRSWAAVDDLRQIVGHEGIVCGLKDKSALYLAGDTWDHHALEAETEARAAIGLRCEYMGGNALAERFGIDRAGAILAPGAAIADPARLAAGLLRRAAARGARIFSPVEALEAEASSEGVTLTTSLGHTVQARHVVYCCGLEFPKPVDTTDARVASTWVVASHPRQRTPAWLRDTLVWEASRPYLYLRMARDGRLIVGGEDEPSGSLHSDPEVMKAKSATLAAKLKRLLPAVDFRVDYSWAAAFGESLTGLPRIAPVEGLAGRGHAVMAFDGNGFTYSVIASQIVAAAIRGEADPDADLYRA